MVPHVNHFFLSHEPTPLFFGSRGETRSAGLQGHTVANVAQKPHHTQHCTPLRHSLVGRRTRVGHGVSRRQPHRPPIVRHLSDGSPCINAYTGHHFAVAPKGGPGEAPSGARGTPTPTPMMECSLRAFFFVRYHFQDAPDGKLKSVPTFSFLFA